MKNIIATLGCLACMAGLTACGGWIEASDNGRLDGNWLIVGIDTVGGGSTDVQGQQRFMSVQGSIVQLRNAANTDSMELYIFRFDYAGSRLTLSDPRVNDRTTGDPVVTDVSVLKPFGLNTLTPTLTVNISGSRMTLGDDRLTIRLKRF